MKATTISTTRTTVDDLPLSVISLWDRIEAIRNKHSYSAWAYGDVPHGDKIRYGRLLAEFNRVVPRYGLSLNDVTFRLTNR